MKLNEYVNMWDKYFSEALGLKKYIPSNKKDISTFFE